MRKWLPLIAATALGAAAAALFDPRLGRRRRRLVGDQARRSWHQLRRSSAASYHHLRNRAKGARHWLQRQTHWEWASDHLLGERVAAIVGHVVTDSHRVRCSVSAGRVTLTGTAPLAEARELRRALAAVPGLRAVDDLTKPTAQQEGSPGAAATATAPSLH